MNIGKSLHSIIVKHGEVIPSGVVRDFGDKFESLVKQGAVRKATDEEIGNFKSSLVTSETASKVTKVKVTSPDADKVADATIKPVV